MRVVLGVEDEALYGRLAAALRRCPDALLGEAASVLESLSGPDADAAPAGHVGIVLEAALDTAGGELAGTVPAYGNRLRDLLEQRDSGLRRLALRWALSLEPEENILELLVAKRGSTHGLDKEFAEVLRSYARHLAGMARDSALDSGERTRALKLAQTADQWEAREAAFEVAGTARVTELRLAAASVLADTEAHPEDAERLERLIADEGDGAARRLLAAALRNISSGTVSGAIENLRSLAALPSEPDRDPRAFLPDEVWDTRFLECVDAARRNSAGDSSNSPLGRRGAAQAAALRDNSVSRPDSGEMIRRQNLTADFPWFSQVAVLREMRGAHPAPIGSTDPVRLGDEDAAYARRLFRDVVAGWEDSMRATQRRLP